MNRIIKTPYLSVGVCAYNREKTIKICIESLIKQNIDFDLMEVIVVDNNSTDSTKDIIQEYVLKYPFIKYYFEPKQGTSFARNRIIKEAEGEVVAYIDDDAEAVENWCRIIIDNFKTHDNMAALGGRIFPVFEIKPKWWFPVDIDTSDRGDEKKFLSSSEGRYGFPGLNLAVRKNHLVNIGGFSDKFGIFGKTMGFGEDSELGYRLFKKAPYFMYDPELTVYHLIPDDRNKILYRIKRGFLHGYACTEIKKTDYSLLHLFIRTSGAFCILPLRNLFKNIVKYKFNFPVIFLHLIFEISNKIGAIASVFHKKKI